MTNCKNAEMCDVDTEKPVVLRFAVIRGLELWLVLCRIASIKIQYAREQLRERKIFIAAVRYEY